MFEDIQSNFQGILLFPQSTRFAALISITRSDIALSFGLFPKFGVLFIPIIHFLFRFYFISA